MNSLLHWHIFQKPKTDPNRRFFHSPVRVYSIDAILPIRLSLSCTFGRCGSLCLSLPSNFPNGQGVAYIVVRISIGTAAFPCCFVFSLCHNALPYAITKRRLVVHLVYCLNSSAWVSLKAALSKRQLLTVFQVTVLSTP